MYHAIIISIRVQEEHRDKALFSNNLAGNNEPRIIYYFVVIIINSSTVYCLFFKDMNITAKLFLTDIKDGNVF